jgi:hypothetical protein
MLPRYRLALFMSSLAVGGALLACPHPDTVYDDFVNRVPDARSFSMDAGCAAPITPADINGTFLLGLNDTTFGSFVFRFIAQVTFTPVGEGGMITWTLTPLDRDTGEVVPPGTMISVGPATVGQCADFRLTAATLNIPGRASVSSDATLSNVVLSGQILDTDRACGRVSGMVTTPAGVPNLESGDGTTFGIIRIAPGTVGAALPDPFIACPESGADAL